MPCYEIDGVRPVVHPTAYVHPDAVLIGDVFVGPGCYVAPLASLRGDFGRIVLEEGSNVQDCCVLHSFPGIDTVVGHNAAHANELAQLAKQLQDMGENVAYEQVMQAVSDFEKGNMRLSTVLAAMNG